MSGPHSILDPVARRLLCTESCPSAGGSDRLNSARSWWCGRWVPLCWRVSLLCADMALTSWLHHADVILGMPALHDDVIIMSCWRHPCPGQSHGSGQLVFGSGQPIEAKKTRVTRGARLWAWPATSPERDGAWGRFWRLILTPFSPVGSSLPPLHSGMVKTQFWQLLFLSKNQTPL